MLGPEVEAFESEFAAASGAAHAVGVGTGTDAITLILRALDIGPGDEVITSPLSAAYSALAVMMAGARPVFADIDPERLTLDPRAVEAAITPRTRAILPVHLYGQAADMRPLEAHRRRGTASRSSRTPRRRTWPPRTAGRSARSASPAATSFYPTKNLGALGDGGAVLTRDAQLAARVEAPAQRRPDVALSPRGGRREQPARRDAGGDPARAPALSAAVDREAARDRRAVSRRARRRARVHVPREFDAGHVYHLFPVLDRARATRSRRT